MTNSIRFLMLAGATVALAACSQCPTEQDYYDTPYEASEDRTAGAGVAVYDGACARPAPVRRTVVREEPVRSAEPVYREAVSK